MSPNHKKPIYRSRKFLEHTRKRQPLLIGEGDNVHHHVKLLKGGGTGLKPPDTHCLCISDSVHRLLDSPNHSEREVFAAFGFTEQDIKSAVRYNIQLYLESKNIDSEKLIIELLTDYLAVNKL